MKFIAGLLLWTAGTTGLLAQAAQTVRARVLAIEPQSRVFVVAINNDGPQIRAAVSPGDAAVPYEGHFIEAQMISAAEGPRLEKIWPADPQALSLMAQLNGELRRDTVARGSRVFRAQGEFMPRFAQFDQNGALFTQERLMGKYTVLNFIFTRCQNPIMCPASTARMAQLQKCLSEGGFLEKTQLVSISLDPSFDTPGILTQYAASHRINGAHHWFLTGPLSVLEDLKQQLGVLTKYADGTLDHTMATLLIDPYGKIMYRHEGSQWTAQIYYNKIEKALSTANTKSHSK